MLKKAWKNIRASFARDMWSKRAVWLSSDFSDEISYDSRKLHLHLFDISLTSGQLQFLLDSYNYLRELQKFGNLRLSLANGGVIAEINGITVEITSAEEIFILREIFLSNDYNFRANQKTVVADIGMNVGMASLYFASRDDVIHVYSYEPFSPTYRQGCRNLDSNPELASKITSYNFGLSGSGTVLEVDFDTENKGQVGILGTDLIRSYVKHVTKEQIELKSILPELERIIRKHHGTDIVCKIDCEGAEYEIFKAFAENYIPAAVKIVMMEWHACGDPDILLEVLLKNGFKCVKCSTVTKSVGMIYAIR